MRYALNVPRFPFSAGAPKEAGRLLNRTARSLAYPVTLLALLLVLTGCRHTHAPATNHATSTPLEQALHTNADAGRLAFLRWPDFRDYKPLVESFYAQRDWDPAWVDNHKATDQAIALTTLFATSAGKGLNPQDYDAPLWPARLHLLADANDQQVAQFDTAMTVAAMRYVSDLHIGRVNPSHFSFGVNVQTKKYDLANFLVQQVVAAKNMNDALKGVEPDSPRYRDTLKALVLYQQMARQTAADPPLPTPGKPLSPGAAYAGAGALTARLQLLGDMPGNAGDAGVAGNGTPACGNLSVACDDTRYTQALAEAVRSFQGRHDLPSDGRLTPQTVAALNIPLDTRVHQLEDTLERMRWLAPEYQAAPVQVNIPEFVLRAFSDDHTLAFQMRVVVGQSSEQDHQTPVLAQQMKYIVLRPFWVVTPTIIKQEIVPHVEADKDYLEAKNFQVVNRTGKPVEHWTTEGLEKNLYMVREKPGPQNSLGLVKFMFPNKLNIYLHSTPAIQLFTRGKRDFSHGCVRIQDPEKLAEWVLRDKPEWTPDKLHDAMENGQDNKTVLLSHPIPVLISYDTARVGEDGKVHFFNDIYGYDKDMEDVLAKGDPFPVKPEPKKLTGDTV